MKILIILLTLFPAAVFSQDVIFIDSVLVKEIISSNMGILFGTEKNNIYLLDSNSREDLDAMEKDAVSNIINTYPHRDFRLVKINSLPLELIELNKVTFQQMHCLELFVTENESGNITLTTSARAIIDLLVYNDYSTSNERYFSFFE